MTLTHVVLLKWKPGTPDGAVEPGLKKLSKVPLTETYILSYRIGKDLCVGRTKMNHDVAVVAEFATEDDYHRYATCGNHLDAVSLLKPHLMHRHAVQTHAREWATRENICISSGQIRCTTERCHSQLLWLLSRLPASQSTQAVAVQDIIQQ